MPLAPRAMERARCGGAAWSRSGRRGKYLVWSLSGDLFLLQHPADDREPALRPGRAPAVTRVEIDLDDGHELRYVDVRRLWHRPARGRPRRAGRVPRRAVWASSPSTPTSMPSTAGPGARQPRADQVLPAQPEADRRRGQHLCDEALFRARIHPLRPAGRLTERSGRHSPRPSCRRCRPVSRPTARASTTSATSTARGRVPGRVPHPPPRGDPCPQCGGTVRRRSWAVAGTYVCERCQPRPRARVALDSRPIGPRLVPVLCPNPALSADNGTQLAGGTR